MKRNPVPSYVLHRQSGRARAVWTDPTGKRWEQLLPGPYNSSESRAAHARLLMELAASPNFRRATEPTGATVNEVLAAFAAWATTHYRTTDGETSSELREFKLVVRHLRELYGTTSAAEFGPLKLKAVRQKFIGEGWSRGVVNQRIGRVKRIIKWAVGEELVPPAVHHGLAAVAGLKPGRCDSPETAPIKPVDPSTVLSTMPFLNRHLRAMVELQRVTGMRPGEVCRFRLADVDRSGEVWVYRPAKHKTMHKGKTRLVMIGPKGRAVIEEFIAGGTVVDPTAPLFSPIRAREERFAAMRENRKSKVQPSQADRRKAAPKRLPAQAYSPGSYSHAVEAAAEKAGVPHWHPNQLRHLYASEVRKSHGLEAAQVLLGHSRADVTQVYAERNEALAATVAAKIG